MTSTQREHELGPAPTPVVVEMPPLVIPSPKVVAEQRPQALSPPPFMIEHHTATPLLHRTSFWVGSIERWSTAYNFSRCPDRAAIRRRTSFASNNSRFHRRPCEHRVRRGGVLRLAP
jgi:hypothetical protein